MGWWPRGAAVAAGVSTSAVVASVVLHLVEPSGQPSPDYFVADAIVGSLFPIAGAVVAHRQPKNAISMVLVAGGLVSLSALGREAGFHGWAGGGPTPVVELFAWFSAWAHWGYAIQPCLLAALFPTGKPHGGRWRWFVRAVLGFAALGAAAGALKPGAIDGLEATGIVNPLGVDLSRGAFIALQAITNALVTIPASLVALGGFVIRLRRSTGTERAQMQWLLLGFLSCLVVILVAAIAAPPDALAGVLFALAFGCIPATIAIAVVRHQLFDIEVVLRRAAIYGALVGIAGITYGGVVLGAAVTGWRGELSPVGAALAVLLASALRSQVTRTIEMRLFGLRRDPLRVIERLNDVAGSDDAAASIEAIAWTLVSSLALPFVSVVREPHGEVIVAIGAAVAGYEEMPVVAEGRQWASLHVGHRDRTMRLAADERTTVVDAARRIATVLQTAALIDDLRESREHLVLAREEERRRLRRDLHDGVGPSLAGLALQLESLAHHAPDNSELAERAMKVRSQLQAATGEIRRLVDGLRPAPVDDLGLAEALRQLQSLDERRVRIDVPSDLGEVPAAVEANAYHIAAEAITNSLRHAAAQHCVVRARSDGDWLVVEVEDDGTGFGPDTTPGVGLQSMHERAAETGGHLTVTSRPHLGTLVSVRLPRESSPR